VPKRRHGFLVHERVLAALGTVSFNVCDTTFTRHISYPYTFLCLYIMYTVGLYMFIEYPQDLIWSSREKGPRRATAQNSDRRGDPSLLIRLRVPLKYTTCSGEFTRI